MDRFIEVIQALQWPLATIVIAGIWILKKPLGELVSRLKTLSPKDGATFADQQQQVQKQDGGLEVGQKTSETKKASSQEDTAKNLLKSTEDPFVIEMETSIDSALTELGLNDPQVTHAVLKRYLAKAQVSVNLNHVYRTIFGSQLILLRQINDRSANQGKWDQPLFFGLCTSTQGLSSANDS